MATTNILDSGLNIIGSNTDGVISFIGLTTSVISGSSSVEILDGNLNIIGYNVDGVVSMPTLAIGEVDPSDYLAGEPVVDSGLNIIGYANIPGLRFGKDLYFPGLDIN